MKDYEKYDGYSFTNTGKMFLNFALGTYRRTEKELINILNQYPFDKIMFDTAFRYGNEKDVANAIIKSNYPKENVMYIGKINTKQQESNKSIRQEFFDTLKRLNLKKIDIYLIHSDRSKKIIDTWKEIIKLQNIGLIDIIGVSNFSQESILRLYENTSVFPEIVQLSYSTKDSDKQQTKLIQFCEENKIHIQIASPFGGEENSKKLTSNEKSLLIKSFHKKGFSCVFGTTKINHLCENLSWLNDEGWAND